MTERVDPVEIIVRIVNKTEKEIAKIEAQLKALTDDIDVDLSIDDNGTISATNQRLNHVARPRIAPIIAQVMGGDGLLQGRIPSPDIPTPTLPGGGDNLPVVYKGNLPVLYRGGGPDPGILGQMSKRFRRLSRTAKKAARQIVKSSGAFDSIGNAVRWIIPTWHQLVAIFAAMVPILIALAVGAAGVAAAFASIGIAGAGLIGLGLVGEGDNMAQAFDRAKRRLGELKRELFQVARPLATLFAPFSATMLSVLPGDMAVMLNAAERLTAFQDSVRAGTRGIFEWLAYGLDVMADYEPMIEDLGDTFGRILGQNIVGFLAFVTEEAFRNKEMIIQLGHAFKNILIAVYNFSTAFSRVLVVLTPVLKLLVFITELLNNKWAIAVASAALAMVGMAKVIAGLITLADILAIKLTTVHLLMGGIALAAGVLAGGFALSQYPDTAPQPAVYNSGRGTQTVNYNISVEGDMSDSTRKEMEQFFRTQSDRRDRFSTNTTSF